MVINKMPGSNRASLDKSKQIKINVFLLFFVDLIAVVVLIATDEEFQRV